MNQSLSVKPAEPHHYERIVDYFLNGDLKFLNGMGVDPKLLPARESWLHTLHENHRKPIEQRNIFYVIWYVDGHAIGHSNINKIIFGKEAYMHLHMWNHETRRNGLGLQLVEQSIPHYFDNFKIKTLWCEPYALNAAPNKTLGKLGFEFIQEYETVPGAISFLQSVKQWRLTENDLKRIIESKREMTLD